ncbi:MAG: hypothetical protein ACR2NP_06025 [Pirellulaceae bacterium]
MNESRYVDPAHFLRSFFVITFHYVMLYLGVLMGMLFIAWLRFPRVFELWTPKNEQEKDRFTEAWENSPELFFPLEMCLWLVALAVVLSLFIGLQVAFWAPFSKAGHGIFLAIVCIVTWLQISITNDQMPKWLMMALLILSPVCIVIASNVGDRWFTKPPDSHDEPDSPAD